MSLFLPYKSKKSLNDGLFFAQYPVPKEKTAREKPAKISF